MDKIDLYKVLFLDENFIHPMCHLCKSETSGWLISEDDLLNTFCLKEIEELALCGLLEKGKEDKFIIYLCHNCLKKERLND